MNRTCLDASPNGDGWLSDIEGHRRWDGDHYIVYPLSPEVMYGDHEVASEPSFWKDRAGA